MKKHQNYGLENTHFETPHGLDNDNHYTTAYELAILTDYALNNKIFYNYVATKSYTININGYPKTLRNTNELLGNLDGVYGVKTGFTNGANRCLVTSCKRGNLDIICIVLGADSKKFRTQDSIKLIEYCFSNYEVINLKQIINDYLNNWKAQNLDKISVFKGVSNNIDVHLKDFNYEYYPVDKKYKNNTYINIDCNYVFEAPLQANTVIGTMEINIGENNVLKFDILNTINIDKKNTLNYFSELLANFFKYLSLTT